MGQKKESIAVTIPAFNEEETLEAVAKEALRELKKITNDYELLLVNDGSTDKTGQIMDRLAKRYKHVRVVHHRTNKGFSGAITTSLKNPTKDLIFLAPADGQFDFKELVKFVEAIGGYDIAFGYRIVNVESVSRKLQSWVYHRLCALLFDIRVKEITSTSLWRRKVTRSLQSTVNPRSNTVLAEFVYQSLARGYKYTEVPIHWYRRRGGLSKGRINLSLITNTLFEMTKLYWRIKQRKSLQ